MKARNYSPFLVRTFWALVGPVLLLACASFIVARKLYFPSVFDIIYVLIAGGIIAARLFDSDQAENRAETTAAVGYSVFWLVISVTLLVLIHLVIKHRPL